MEEEEEAEEEEEETLARSVTGGCLVGGVGEGQQKAWGQEMKMSQEMKKTEAIRMKKTEAIRMKLTEAIRMIMLSRPITKVLAGEGGMQKGRRRVGMCRVSA